MEKPELKIVKKAVRELNKLGLLEEKVDIKLDIDELIKSYMIGIMRVSDLGQEEKINENMLSVYNGCMEYMESLDNSSGNSGEFDREELEEMLSEMDEDELQEFIDEYDLEVEIDADDLGNAVEEVLDAMEEKADNSSDDSSDDNNGNALKNALKKMTAKEVKAFLKENAINIKIKIKDWKDSAEQGKIIAEIIKLSESKKEGDSKPDNSKIREELYKMPVKEVKAFLKEKGIDIKIKIKDWKDSETKTKIVCEIAEKLDAVPVKLPESRDDREEMLQELDYEEIMKFIDDHKLTEEVSEVEEDDFEDEQEDLIEEILDALEEKDKTSAKPKIKKTTGGKRGPQRKTGNTVQEIIARVIKDSEKALTKKEIIDKAVKVREEKGESITSVPNFTNIVLLTGIALGVIKHDTKKDTYKLK